MSKWYVYRSVDGKMKYLGAVKAKNGKVALRSAHEMYDGDSLDVIRSVYVSDRKLGTMRGPKKL